VKGREFFLRLEARYFDESKIEVAENLFQKYGIRIVIFNRFLPTVRAFVGIVAGIIQMRPPKVVLCVLVGTFIWNSLLVYFGLMVGENWQLVITVLRTYNQVVITLALLGAACYYGWKWRKRRDAEGDISGLDVDIDRAGEQEKGRAGEEAEDTTDRAE